MFMKSVYGYSEETIISYSKILDRSIFKLLEP